MIRADEDAFIAFFQHSSAGIDTDRIYREWQAVKRYFKIENRTAPVPLWARRKLTEDGRQAFQVLKREMEDLDPGHPMCIYVHFPFCSQKCGFCDCYSIALRKHSETHIHQYVGKVEQEIRLWSQIGALSSRPVSTVHFGGGSPLFMGKAALRGLVGVLRSDLRLDRDIEWALETSSSDLTPTNLDLLDELGFTRIHVGVQSFDSPVREGIGRRETGDVVYEKIAMLKERGKTVSVDLIYGLPGQTLESLLRDLHLIASAGIDGVSLYVLQVSARNRRFLNHRGLPEDNLQRCYLLNQAASQTLTQYGFRKTLFNHFARERDTNLYFNFPERDEDCLALGTIADGVIGSYHYRHLEYRDYMAPENEPFVGLQGGLRRSPQENHLRPLEIAILSARLSKNLFDALLGRDRSDKLFAAWQEAMLVEPIGEKPGSYALTASGSWLVSEMINRLS